MISYKVKLYFKDNPEEILDRIVGELEYEDNLEDIEQLPEDDDYFYYFYYLTEPDEMEELKNPENNEEFVIIKVG